MELTELEQRANDEARHARCAALDAAEAAERLERPHPQDVAHGYKAEPTTDELWDALSAAYAALDAAEARERMTDFDELMAAAYGIAASLDEEGYNGAIVRRALDAAEAEKRAAYKEGWRFAYHQWANTGSVPDPEYTPAAIRQETNDAT
jgi:hypothetical protein